MTLKTKPTQTTTLDKPSAFKYTTWMINYCVMRFVWEVSSSFLNSFLKCKSLKIYFLNYLEIPIPVPEAKCLIDGLSAIQLKWSILDPSTIHSGYHVANIRNYNDAREAHQVFFYCLSFFLNSLVMFFFFSFFRLVVVTQNFKKCFLKLYVIKNLKTSFKNIFLF